MEFVVGKDNCGIGTEDGCGGVQDVDGAGLFEGEALDVGGGRFVGMAGFVDVGREDVEAQTGLQEEVSAAGGGGGED